MHKHLPTVMDLMTPFPSHVEMETPLNELEELFQTHDIHHLPVLDDDEPVGLVTAADLARARQWGMQGELPEELVAWDLCRRRPVLVDIHDPLERVLDTMSTHRLGAVLVMREGNLAGIITSADACRAFAHWLREQNPTIDPECA